MPRFGRASRNARNPRTPDPALEGWAGIEDHMYTHDDEQMSDYADDIDTMLVFAGLFSAIVTGFVVPAYQSIQPDSSTTTNQLIAFQISSGNHANVSPSISSTITDLLAPQSSQLPTSLRWINALFFLSLFLSIAAALLGIIAKQWIREFLKWNSTLGTPRENVLVRQIRFEAWEQWRVEGIFWSIPILLEMGMVLFLAGITVLLWTLDDILAKTITIVVSIFLGVVAMITILPILVKRCPYKSPTSWVLLRLYTVLRYSCISILYNIASNLQSHIHYGSSIYNHVSNLEDLLDYLSIDLIAPKTWRNWDLDSCRAASWYGRSWPWYSESAKTYALGKLNEEARDLSLIPVKSDDKKNQSFNDTHLWYVVRDIREMSVLLRALSWVKQASESERVIEYIDQSMQSIHTASILENDKSNLGQLRAAVGRCILWAWGRNEMDHPHLILTATDEGPQKPENKVHSFRQLHGAIRSMRMERTIQGHQRSFFEFGAADFSYLYRLWPSAGISLGNTFFQSLAVDLCQATAVLQVDRLPAATNPLQENHQISTKRTWWSDEDCFRRVVEILSLMEPLIYRNLFFRARDIHLDGFRAIMCVNSQQKTQLDMSAPLLRFIAFKVSCQIAEVTICLDREEIVINTGSMDYLKYQSLLLSYFTAYPSSWSNSELNMFIFCVYQWLSMLPLTPVPSSVNVRRILIKIRNTVNLLAARTDFEICSIDPLFGTNWLDHFTDKSRDITSEHKDRATTAAFEDILHTFVFAYRYQNFMEEHHWRQYLHNNLCAIHKSPCGIMTCPWNAHACDNLWNCPLLKKATPARPRITSPFAFDGLEERNPSPEQPFLRRIQNTFGTYSRRLVQTISLGTRTHIDNPLELAERGARSSRNARPRRGQITVEQLIGFLQQINGSLVLAPIPESIFYPLDPAPPAASIVETSQPIAEASPGTPSRSESSATPRAGRTNGRSDELAPLEGLSVLPLGPLEEDTSSASRLADASETSVLPSESPNEAAEDQTSAGDTSQAPVDEEIPTATSSADSMSALDLDHWTPLPRYEDLPLESLPSYENAPDQDVQDRLSTV